MKRIAIILILSSIAFIKSYGQNNITTENGSTVITGPPGATLTLKKPSNNVPALVFQGQNNSTIIESGDDYLTAYIGNARRLTILANGKVGIGTSSPQQTLDVQGSFRIGSDENYLMYNGGADVRLRYSDRGSGGRAIVHDTGNRLTLNVGGDFTGGTSIGMGAYFTPGTTGTSYLYYGSFGVGTSDTKGYKFAVAGSAIAESVTVKLLGNWPDFVFKDNYQLTTLEETGRFIKDNGHLPGIPSAVEVKTKGIDLGEMNAKLLQKIEELTLHLIEQQKNAKREKKISEENRIRLDKEILELKEMIEKK